MNTNRIFLGNIMYGTELIQTTVLLKCKNDVYINLDNILRLTDIYKIEHNKSDLITFSTIYNEDNFYIDKESLKPYYEKEKNKSLIRIKHDILVDSRNTKGIDH